MIRIGEPSEKLGNSSGLEDFFDLSIGEVENAGPSLGIREKSAFSFVFC